MRVLATLNYVSGCLCKADNYSLPANHHKAA
nr:MAG TPA: hypothetical protein [Caudoviricetes sp.]